MNLNNGGLVVISDLHFGNHKQWANEVTDTTEFPGCNSRMYNIVYAVRAAVDFAVKHEAEAIIVAGDIFHERKVIEVAVFNAVYSLFHEISEKVPLFIIPGNHDMVDLHALYGDRGLVSVYPFKNFCNVIYKPTLIDLKSFNVGLLPFNMDVKKVIESSSTLYSNIDKTKFSVSIYHHSFDGAVFGGHQFKMPSPLKISDLPTFDLNLSGHYHFAQTLKSKNNSLTYIGSIVQHNFGEATYNPGFLYIEKSGKWTHIPNGTSPKFKIYEAEKLSQIKDYKDTNYNLIRWSGSTKEGSELKERYKTAFVHSKPKEEVSKIRTTIESTDSPDKILKKYVDVKLGESPKAVEFYKFGLDLLDKDVKK